MSGNKQPISRIRKINECLIKGGYWSKEKLLDKISEIDLDISSRTLDSDIGLMRNCQQLNYNSPIKYCRKNNGYHYTDPNYSIDKIPLNKKDVNALVLAASTLKQYQYIPLMKEFNGAIDKIIRVVNRVKKDEHKSILEFIEFEKTPVAIGIEFMDDIVEAILNSKVIKISYQKFGGISEKVLLHPYFIKEYRNRWYLIGLKNEIEQIRTYAYDRMIKVEQVDVPLFKTNTYINTETYLRHCIGINQMEGKIEKVLLQFNSKEGNYIKTQKLHNSQSILTDNNDFLLIELQLIINFELIGIILSYGANVKVLEPKHLADKICDIASRTVSQYD